ncbi:DUF3114 domain-containing protein [Enterococcus larvae]|uniref:DUF3114 domain-containing protein n=1 Tax=Enterococcus larvae TaxID=2794352 RepID=UPI003F3B1F2C
MSIDMYLSTAKSQATGAATMGKSHAQGYEALQKAAQSFANDSVLQADAYTSAKGMFNSVIVPLIQAGQLLSESVAEACQKFPEEYTAQVDSGDLKSSELEEKIQRLGNEIQTLHAIRSSIESRDTADNMKLRQLNSNKNAIAGHEAAKKKLEEQLQKLLDFHASSPSLFSEITTLTNAVNQGSSIAGKSWHAASGTFKLPEGTDMSWTKDVNNRWQNRQFAKKYDVQCPKDMTAKEYQEYLKTLRDQKDVLCKEDGWDEEAFKAYMKHVNKNLASGGKDVFDRLNQINVETRLVGSGVYEMMFDAADMTEQQKVRLVLKQMGAAIDENNMLQLQGTHKFDPTMPPHSEFLEKFAESVQKGYPEGLIIGGNIGVNEEELRMIHQFRHFIDLQNLYYIRANFEGATDYEKLLAYAKETKQDLLYGDTAQFHNRVKFSVDKNGEIIRDKDDKKVKENLDKQLNDKIKTQNGLSEFIVNVETGAFVSQWDQLKTEKGEEIFIVENDKVVGVNSNKINSNYKDYDLVGVSGKEIADTESFNYEEGDRWQDVILKGEWEMLLKNGKHNRFDMKPGGSEGLDSNIRSESKKKWPYPEPYNELYNSEKDIRGFVK